MSNFGENVHSSIDMNIFLAVTASHQNHHAIIDLVGTIIFGAIQIINLENYFIYGMHELNNYCFKIHFAELL